jgi:anaerobic selenocysteine-containing dehydrogenase
MLPNQPSAGSLTRLLHNLVISVSRTAGCIRSHPVFEPLRARYRGQGRATVGVRGSVYHSVNFGHLGPKGEHGWVANHSRRRGATPMIRRKKSEALRPVGWPEAMEFFIEKFRKAWNVGREIWPATIPAS